ACWSIFRKIGRGTWWSGPNGTRSWFRGPTFSRQLAPSRWTTPSRLRGLRCSAVGRWSCTERRGRNGRGYSPEPPARLPPERTLTRVAAVAPSEIGSPWKRSRHPQQGVASVGADGGGPAVAGAARASREPAPHDPAA